MQQGTAEARGRVWMTPRAVIQRGGSGKHRELYCLAERCCTYWGNQNEKQSGMVHAGEPQRVPDLCGNALVTCAAAVSSPVTKRGDRALGPTASSHLSPQTQQPGAHGDARFLRHGFWDASHTMTFTMDMIFCAYWNMYHLYTYTSHFFVHMYSFSHVFCLSKHTANWRRQPENLHNQEEVTQHQLNRLIKYQCSSHIKKQFLSLIFFFQRFLFSLS